MSKTFRRTAEDKGASKVKSLRKRRVKDEDDFKVEKCLKHKRYDDLRDSDKDN